MPRSPRMSRVPRLAAAALLAASATAPAAVLFTAPQAGAATGAGTVAHADPSSPPPSPDYVCDDLMIIRPPHVLLDEVYANNCETQPGVQYGYFTDKIIAERHAPQAHIHCKKGWVREKDRHFWALDLDCDLVWPHQGPS